IWIGAYKPRMLRLLARKADGWLPSLGYATLEQLAEGNARIDEAAEGAGRRPREIRRLLNVNGTFLNANRGFLTGPPKQWAQELAELALEQGFGTFILSGDDPTAIQAFGEEVAPAVREIVARERGEPAPERPRVTRLTSGDEVPRSDDIAYDEIPASLRDEAVAPGDPAYERVRSTYMQEGRPGLVLMAEDPEHVSEAILFARSQPVPLSIRSGGHGALSTNDGGIIIDVSRLNGIEIVDEATRRVRVGPGATWGQVAQALAPYGWAMTSGDAPDVGVGGIATGGGIGLLARKFGLMIDHIVAAEVALADGRIVRTSEDEHPDLFWAIRGAGANVGIVTAIEFEALPVRNVISGMFVLDATDMAGVLARWGAYMEAAPRELQNFLYLSPARRGQPPVAQIYAVWANDDVPAATAALEPLLRVGPLIDQQAQVVPYAALMTPQNAPHAGQQTLRGRTGLLDHLNRETADAVVRLMKEGRVPWANFRTLGGAVNDVPAGATAWAHRSQAVAFTALDLYPDLRNLDPAWQAFEPHTNGIYINLHWDTSEESVRQAYPSPTYERLQRVKTEYDPENVFSRNFNVPPLVRVP
ncbi:MAG TPA: LLM class flavin-dependent oxidoreductase, partial [Thermomicrobiales bacterium]|nr:LLM class flavin-dependent oxidoreductase [Thermomicrobiales bacterium]